MKLIALFCVINLLLNCESYPLILSEILSLNKLGKCLGLQSLININNNSNCDNNVNISNDNPYIYVQISCENNDISNQSYVQSLALIGFNDNCVLTNDMFYDYNQSTPIFVYLTKCVSFVQNM